LITTVQDHEGHCDPSKISAGTASDTSRALQRSQSGELLEALGERTGRPLGRWHALRRGTTARQPRRSTSSI
jgi:hypothetical protein